MSANRKRQKTKKEEMVELLRDAMLAGEIAPGERLMQDDLAERFNVSSTPVREAIQQLVAEGVLQHSPYKGVQVAEISLEAAHEVYLIRSVVESLATRLAVPNLRLADVKRLRDLHTQIEALPSEDRPTLLRLNREFHYTFYNAAGAPLLLQIIKSLWIRSPSDTLIVVPNRSRMIVDEHRAVLEAVEAGDAALAGQRMQEHIERGEAALSAYLQRAQNHA